MKDFIRFIIGLLIFATFFYALSLDAINWDKRLKNSLGKNVIINNDTLMIVDYSAFKRTVTLDNGTEINYELIKILDNKKIIRYEVGKNNKQPKAN